MRHPWFVPGLLALAALAGYAVGARPVQAQGEAFPFQLGEIVTFSLQDDGQRDCRIEELRGYFARCGNPSQYQPPGIRQPEAPEEWVNIAAVKLVTKGRQRR
jgi:hypothetical protein